ncbi:hypothetical protein V8G54_013876 [Vigna mungo]|uniref:Uncharacterized protein n=1 Tax=Vigna mungo TaxID=3915 RepID=A0AAQ3RYS4_VIGMU
MHMSNLKDKCSAAFTNQYQSFDVPSGDFDIESSVGLLESEKNINKIFVLYLSSPFFRSSLLFLMLFDNIFQDPVNLIQQLLQFGFLSSYEMYGFHRREQISKVKSSNRSYYFPNQK